MTGIEIFANLVAAYQGFAAERRRKALLSLVIVKLGSVVDTVLQLTLCPLFLVLAVAPPGATAAGERGPSG
jgi:hypothetical protein